MKFLHTSDWHLGKMLHKYSLEEDMELFLDWMYTTLENEAIDTVLISGDIFDVSNPAIQDRKRYYQVLSKLSTFCDNVIITGGNHDSAGMLNAPSDILETLNIRVIGGINKEKIEEEIIPIYKGKEVEAIVLAVPYLRDRDIKQFTEGMDQQEKVDATREGIKKHYSDLVDLAQKEYGKKVPIIAMGHLFLQGASVSDSERDISIGNLDAVDHQSLTKDIAYMALGHIHRPQKVDQQGKIRYSGSPIPLSFSERKDQKRIIIGTLEKGKLKLESIAVPTHRRLIKLTGSLTEIREKLKNLKADTTLPSLIELSITEEHYDPSIPLAINELKESYEKSDFIILKERIHYQNSPTKISELYKRGEDIEDLKPSEVFEKRIETDTSLSDIDKELLRDAYREILDSLHEEL
jgi:exonuclease SbcD